MGSLSRNACFEGVRKGMQLVCHNQVTEKAEKNVRILSLFCRKKVKEGMGKVGGSNSTSLLGCTPLPLLFVQKQCYIEQGAQALKSEKY